MIKQLLLIAAMFCMLFPVHAQKSRFDLQGKAGARAMAPENTIPGMITALGLNVTTLEMDAVITKDNKVILSQEPYFNHEISLTPQGKAIPFKDQKKYNIYKMDYEEVEKFDVGSKIHPRFPGQRKVKVSKPLLADVIDAVESHIKANRLKKVDYSIEAKLIPKGDGEFQPDPATFIDLIMDVVNEKKIAKRVIIQSFDMRALQYLHEKYPKIRTSLLIDEKESFDDYIAKLGFKPTIYSPYSLLVGKGLVDRCHEAGVKIIPWTVNSLKDLKYFMELGVDGVITDYPNLMSQL